MIDASLQDRSVTAESESERPWLSALEVLWQARGRLLKWAVSGALISVVAAFVIPVRFTATVDLMPPDSSLMNLGLMAAMTGVTPSSSASAGLASNLLNGRTASGTFIGIVQSRATQDDLINRFDLRRVYRVKTYQDARKKLSDRTYASEDRKSGIVTIAVEDHDRYRARDLAQAYVEELNKLVAAMDTSSAHREREFLETRLVTVKQDLDSASLQLSQFSSKNAEFDVPDQGKAALDATARLQGQLIDAESQLEGLKALYTEGNARVEEARARVDELQRSLAKIGGTGAAGPAGEGTEPLPSLRQIPLLGYTYLDLYRRVQIEQGLYETLTKQYELAKIEEAKEIPTVKVLDPAQVPEKKSFPPRFLTVVLGTLLALFLAVVAEFTGLWWRNLDEADRRKVVLREIAGVRRQSGWSRRLGLARGRRPDPLIR